MHLGNDKQAKEHLLLKDQEKLPNMAINIS